MSKPMSKRTNKENGWQKYFNAIGLLGFLIAIAYVTPLAGVPSSNISLLSRVNDYLHVNDYFQKGAVIPPVIPPIIDEAAKYENSCPFHQFDSVKVVSRAPDVMIIEGFLTKFEAEHLLELA
jgi:hypothetical protein